MNRRAFFGTTLGAAVAAKIGLKPKLFETTEPVKLTGGISSYFPDEKLAFYNPSASPLLSLTKKLRAKKADLK